MRQPLLTVALLASLGAGCGEDWLLLEVDADCGARACKVGSDFDYLEVSLWEEGPGGMSPTELAASGRALLGADAFSLSDDMALPMEVLVEPDGSAPDTLHAAVVLLRNGTSVGEVVAEIAWDRGQTNRAAIEVPVGP